MRQPYKAQGQVRGDFIIPLSVTEKALSKEEAAGINQVTCFWVVGWESTELPFSTLTEESAISTD